MSVRILKPATMQPRTSLGKFLESKGFFSAIRLSISTIHRGTVRLTWACHRELVGRERCVLLKNWCAGIWSWRLKKCRAAFTPNPPYSSWSCLWFFGSSVPGCADVFFSRSFYDWLERFFAEYSYNVGILVVRVKLVFDNEFPIIE